MQQIVIRQFSAPDQSGVTQCILNIQRGEYGMTITAQDQPDLFDISDFYQNGAGDFWVACIGDAIVGTIALKDIGDGAAALRKMFVAAEYRGRATGVASALLSKLIAHARENGLRAIYLGTTAHFLAAHRFYERSGFALIAADDLPASFPRMAVDTRFYRMDLTSPAP